MWFRQNKTFVRLLIVLDEFSEFDVEVVIVHVG